MLHAAQRCNTSMRSTNVARIDVCHQKPPHRFDPNIERHVRPCKRGYNLKCRVEMLSPVLAGKRRSMQYAATARDASELGSPACIAALRDWSANQPTSQSGHVVERPTRAIYGSATYQDIAPSSCAMQCLLGCLVRIELNASWEFLVCALLSEHAVA